MWLTFVWLDFSANLPKKSLPQGTKLKIDYQPLMCPCLQVRNAWQRIILHRKKWLQIIRTRKSCIWMICKSIYKMHFDPFSMHRWKRFPNYEAFKVKNFREFAMTPRQGGLATISTKSGVPWECSAGHFGLSKPTCEILAQNFSSVTTQFFLKWDPQNWEECFWAYLTNFFPAFRSDS